MAKIWTNWDTIISLSRKHCGKRRNCSLRAIPPFPTMFSKAVICRRVEMSIMESRVKGSQLVATDAMQPYMQETVKHESPPWGQLYFSWITPNYL